ncbi:MAG: amino acid adenylation domain-containing protein [Pseudomonadota bacterium]
MISAEKIAALRERIARLPPADQRVLVKQLEAQGIDGSLLISSEDLKASSARPEVLPLAAQQSHLWVLQQLYPALTAYHIALAWRFRGQLDKSALEAALGTIIERHESLRTCFPTRSDGRPHQRIEDYRGFRLSERRCDEGSALPAIIDAIVAVPFDLASGPLYRIELMDSAPGEHVLIMVFHHMIADGWSRGILLEELQQAYAAHHRGEPPHFAPLDRQFADLVVADDTDQGRDASLRWWQDYLRDVKPLALPCDHSRNDEPDFNSRTLTWTVKAELADRARELASQQSATLFQTLFAVFQILLYRYTAQSDICVGVPIAGRQQPGAEQLIGFFVNSLVVRSQIANPGAQNFSGWLDCAKRNFADCVDHADVPFAQVVDAVTGARDPSRNPLFDVMFQVQSDHYRAQNASTLSADWSGLTVEQIPVLLKETKFDLTWHVFDREEGFFLGVEYRTGLFEQATIKRLIRDFERLLTIFCDEPGRHVGTIDLLDDTTRKNVLAHARGPKLTRSFPTIVEAFAATAQERPHAIAVRTGKRELSFADLDARASALATRLSADGVGSEYCVAVCVPRQPELLVALLGVMKSGAAFVPIDPELPAERLALILADAECAAIVAAAETADLVKQINRLDAPVFSACPAPDVTHVTGTMNIGDESLAYIMYTSGSSGKPKGVQISHAALMSYIDWCMHAYPWDRGSGVPVQSSVGFDATITSLLAPLIAGQTVHLLPEEDVLPALAAALEQRPSLAKLTPAHLQAIAPLMQGGLLPEQLPGAFIIGGEALSAQHVGYWRKTYPSIRLINEYGPTETTVGCCVHEVTDADHTAAIPIGRPITGAELYVLDADMNLVPDHVPGELYIGGAAVARGYLKQPRQTAASFVPNPYQSTEGKASRTLYRTGDRVVRGEDGVLTYLGRVDEQIQLRGYRIEPEEIEYALASNPALAAAAVAVRERAGRGTLIAYLRFKDPDNAPTNFQAAFDHWLGERLPRWMMPEHYVAIDELPLTANGKLDRQHLPTLAPLPAAANVPAQSDVEKSLLNAWRMVLNQDEIGITDNFFERGGDSIAAMQVVARAREAGWSLEPRQLFEHQTVAEQAGVARPVGQLTVAEEPGEGGVPLGPIQAEFLSGNPSDPHHFNQSILIDCEKPLALERLETCLAALVDHHDTLRLRFAQAHDGTWRQFYAKAQAAVIPVTAIMVEGGEDALKKVISEYQTSLNVTDGPLLRVVYLRRAGHTREQLLVVAHHLIVDGVSWRVFLSDLGTLYRATVDNVGQQETLAAKTNSFRSWTEHIANSMHRFKTEESYWRGAIENPSPLPSDRTALVGPVRENDAVEHLSILPSETVDRILSQAAKADPETLLLAALFATLSQWSGVPKQIVDIEGHGRHSFDIDLDLSRTLGWFTVRYPLRMSWAAQSPAAQIENLRSSRQAVPSSGVGFSALAQHDASLRSPAEISFNYLGRLDAQSHAGGFTFANQSVGAQRSARHLRRYPLEVIAMSMAGEMKIIYRYDSLRWDPATIERLGLRFVANLEPFLAFHDDPSATKSPASLTSTDPKKDALLARLAARGR